MVAGESSLGEYLKFAVVIGSILLLSLLLAHISGAVTITDWLRWFMGIFFVVFGAFKLVGYRMFVEMFAGYDIIARRLKAYSYAYPFIELLLGGLYLVNVAPRPRDVITFIVMAVGSVGVAQEVKRRTGIHCACLGNVIKLPLSTVSLVEDVGMGAMALCMLFIR